MISKFKVTVIIAFYNNVKFLDLVIAGFMNQTEPDFEIIIADDGSEEKNRSLAEEILKKSNIKFQYLWQPDEGFLKNKILNKAIVASRSDFLIFIDQDCIPHYKFIEEHLKRAKRGVVQTGRRVNLSKEISENLTTELIHGKYLEKNTIRWIWHGLTGRMNYGEKGVYLPWLSWFFYYRKKSLLGSNFSCHKLDLLDINGFDETYNEPTFGEDSDIDLRMRYAGKKIKYLGNIAIQYHIYHKPLSRENGSRYIFQKNLEAGKSWIQNGIQKNLF